VATIKRATYAGYSNKLKLDLSGIPGMLKTNGKEEL
jgi:hypothetical protein